MSVDSSSSATGDWRRLRRDRGERVAMALPGLQVVVGRDGPLPARVDLEVQVRRRADGVAGVADEADDVARVDVRAVLGDRRVGREVRVVEPVAVRCPRSTGRQPPRRFQPTLCSTPRCTATSGVPSGANRSVPSWKPVSAREVAEVVAVVRAAGDREDVARASQLLLAPRIDGRRQREAARRRRLDAGRGDAVARVRRRVVARRHGARRARRAAPGSSRTGPPRAAARGSRGAGAAAAAVPRDPPAAQWRAASA